MKKRQGIHNAVLAVFLGVFAACGFAQVVEGQDDATHNNNTPAAAQRLTINADAAGTTGGASVQGVLGNLSGSAVADLDFYSFYGRAGDVVTIDIDGGIGGARSVDTILAIFGPAPQYAKKRENDDASSPVDEGSTSRMDSRIDNFTLDVDGVYTIGVSSWPRFFNDGGTLTSTSLNSRSNGDYTLNITGVSLPMVFISIEIKPGSGERAPINPKAKGVVPVALLGSSRFNALAVKRDSLRFGTTGYESSWLRCAKEGEDVNSDGYLDLVCHFDNRLTKFVKGDLEGILRGETGDGYQLEGRGLLKVVPEKREDL
jgi:hypothetical protein